MGAMCRADLPKVLGAVRATAGGVAPLTLGDGVKARPPGEANWLPNSCGQVGVWTMPLFQAGFALNASLLSDDGVENTALGDAVLNMEVASRFPLDSSEPNWNMPGLIVCCCCVFVSEVAKEERGHLHLPETAGTCAPWARASEP